MSVVIFDFDGTIADTFETVLRISNRLSGEYGFLPKSWQEVQQLQNLGARQIIRQLKIPPFQIPRLLRRLRAELNQEINQLQAIQGMEDTLPTLHQQGHRLGIVTSNSCDNVLTFLKNHGLESLFEFVTSEMNLFGKGRAIRRVLHQQHLKTDRVIYVGDETRDIEAARKIGIRVIAVGWGFNSPEVLASFHPDALIYHPQELLKAVETLSQQLSHP